MNYQEALENLKMYALRYVKDDDLLDIVFDSYSLLKERINQQEQVESTMFGFPINHLKLIANLLRKNGITPEILKSSIESMKYGYDLANQEMKESFENTFKTMKKEHTHE